MLLEGIGAPLTVWRRTESGEDAHGEPVASWAGEQVDGCLWGPSSADDLPDAARPEGTADRITVHFPNGYTAGLSGCRLELCGLAEAEAAGGIHDRWRVIGDPQPYMEGLCPGPWGLQAVARKVEG